VVEKRRRFNVKRRECGIKKLWSKLKASKGKEKSFMKDFNHKISRKIIGIARGYPNTVVVMEKLTRIRSKVRGTGKYNGKINNWNFRQLQEFIECRCHASKKFQPIKASSVCTNCGHLAISGTPFPGWD